MLKNRLSRLFHIVRELHPPQLSSTSTIPFLLVILIRWNNETLYIQLLLFVAKYVFKALELPVWIFYDLLILRYYCLNFCRLSVDCSLWYWVTSYNMNCVKGGKYSL